eukprot:COSAG04_NODE_4702_length_1939_cov_1.565761_1_plen_483_part_00
MVAMARLLALLLLLSSHAASRPARRSAKGRSRRTRPAAQPLSLPEALIAPDDAALSVAQHEGLAEARRTVQDDMADGVQLYAALAQRAMAAGELEAADKVIAEGMAVVGSAGEEAEFLSGALLMVSASVHRCSNRHADALRAFDRMAELLPVDLDANPERQEGVRSLFRLDLIKLLLASTGVKGAAGLRRRRKAEEQALLQLGPWPSLAQLPRDYQRGLRSQPVWGLEESLGGEGTAELLSALAEARPRLVAEHRRLKAQGKMSPERECIHDAAAGEWSQYDFLGGAAAARQRAASRTAVLLDRPPCESGIAPAGCAFVTAVETAVFGRPGSVWAAGLAAGANVLRAGYSALEPVRALIRSRLGLFRLLTNVVGWFQGAHIRPHFGETNAQLKLHLGLTVPTDADTGKSCAWLRVGEATVDGDGSGGREEWAEGGAILFDDSFEHEVRWSDAECGRGHRDVLDARARERVVLQLVLPPCHTK